MRRSILAFALVTAVVAAGCGITSSVGGPTRVAPSLAPGEQPVQELPLIGTVGIEPLTLRIYDRSLALDEARSAARHELAGLEQFDPNAIGMFQSVTGEVLITWQGSACAGTDELFVGPGVAEVLIVPGAESSCDAGSSLHGVHLVFRPNVDLERISVSFARAAA